MQMQFLKKFFHQEFVIIFLLFLDLFIFLLSVSVLPAHTHAGYPPVSARGITSPFTGAMDGCEPPCKC